MTNLAQEQRKEQESRLKMGVNLIGMIMIIMITTKHEVKIRGVTEIIGISVGIITVIRSMMMMTTTMTLMIIIMMTEMI